MENRRRVLERSDLYAPVRREWTLRELLAIFRRRRWMVIGCASVLVVLAGVYCALVTPHYRATGQVEVLKDEPGTLGLDRSITGASAESDSSALDTSMTLQTEARVLQSSTLALRVIKDLKLEETADYFAPEKRGIQERLLFWRKPLEPLNVPLDEAPRRRYAALRIFSRHLKVLPVTGTRLIDVSYSSSDPKTASAVVNELMAALQKYTFESRFQATAQASDWLSGQLAGLKKQTE
ncbi:MAG: Wzz/FepE/Etk N-terminal domain-containing protein, partial [Acidobacteriaceae bacterium]